MINLNEPIVVDAETLINIVAFIFFVWVVKYIGLAKELPRILLIAGVVGVIAYTYAELFM